MKIIKIKAENIKKLTAVEIVPTGRVTKITGKNASGKTCVLDLMSWGLGGAGAIQGKPVRKGQEEGFIELDFEDIRLKRTFNDQKKTTALIVENKDGLRFKSPQSMLDGLYDARTFDVSELMDDRKLFETLRQLTGVDFSKLDGVRQRTYDERSATNRDVKRLEVQIEGMDVPADAPKEEVSGAEIVAKMQEVNKLREKRSVLEAEIQQLENAAMVTQQEMIDIQKRIYDLEAIYKTKEDSVSKTAAAIEDAEEKMKAVQVPDISALNTELAQVESKNKAARAYQARVSARNLLQQLKDVAKDLTDKIQAVDEEKQKQLAEAKFPLDGLGFGDSVVTYNGLPIDQASRAERIKVMISMAIALKPKLRVFRMSDGSLLDAESEKVIEEMCENEDYQAWIEQMDESGKVGIVISEGEVVAVNE